MKTFLKGKYSNDGGSCPQFVATNYYPSKDEILVQIGNFVIFKSGVVFGYNKDYADQLAHCDFSYVSPKGEKYEGTTFGGMSMTKELYEAIKTKYQSHVNAKYIHLMDYDKQHKEFVQWCKDNNAHLISWCYGEYQLEKHIRNCDIPFYLKGDNLKIVWYDFDGNEDYSVYIKPTFFCDARFYARSKNKELLDDYAKIFLVGKSTGVKELDTIKFNY